MDHVPILILVATCGRTALLDRFYQSLGACALPPNPIRLLIAFNGSARGQAPVIPTALSHWRVEFRHTAQPNKSLALNQAIFATAPREFVLFFDDDVRLDPDTLVAYAKAVNRARSGVFIGGRCLIDYDEAPPNWLRPYLPNSARGWSLGDTCVRLEKPHALGFNWGAFAGDIQRCGGFDTESGPGTPRGIGEEAKLQQRLMEAGITGLFLPGGVAWHYVPRERCSSAWALDRAFRNGLMRGVAAAATNGPRMAARCWLRLLRCSAVLTFSRGVLRPEKRFHYEYWRERHRGMLKGLQVARRAAPSPPPAASSAPALAEL